MLKKITFLCFIFYLFFSCNEESITRIKVNLSNLQAQEIYAVFESAGLRTVDTIIYNGRGSFTITKEPGGYRTLTLYYDNFKRWITIYLEQPQRIIVTGDASFPQMVQVKGGRINELLSVFRKETAAIQKEYVMLLNNGYSTPEKLNGINIARLANISNELRLQAEAFIQKNPGEEASAILIRDYFLDPDNINQIDNLLDVLTPQLNDFYVVQDLRAYTGEAKRTAIGAQAPDFNVKNIYGNAISTDSLKNRYFVLAFTYLWNDLCHTNELQLDDIIHSFPKDSLNVMIVSLDENPQELRELIRKEPIRWNVVIDSAGQTIRLLELYNVNVLPRSFLIDKEGTILLKTDNGVELKKTLESLMPK